MIPFDKFLSDDNNAVLIKTSYRVDLTRLQQFFNQEVKPLRKEYQGTKTWHGGWSIQSNTGDIEDGWQPGGDLVKKLDGSSLGIDPTEQKKMFPMGYQFNTPTALYKDLAEELVMELHSGKFGAKRTRFAELEVGGVDSWHRDSPVGPMWRGHIVVETNPDCLFWWASDDGARTVKYNIPADGHLYMARVDRLHRITNHGQTDRVHVLTDSSTPLSECLFHVEPLLFLQP